MIRNASSVSKVILTAFVSGCLILSMAGAAVAVAGEKDPSAGGPLGKDARIKTIEELVQGVNAGITEGKISTAQRGFEYCQPYGIVGRYIARDASDRVRMYEERGGSDNSDRRIRRYYTEAGQLRFVAIHDKARGGGELEQKVYFDEAGKRLWVDNKVIGAPEDNFPSNYPDDVLVIEKPDKAFAAPSPCKEIAP